MDRGAEVRGLTRERSATNFIVIHTTATPPDEDIGAADIHRRHLARGSFGIGHHWVVRRSGLVEAGRAEETVGAHDPDMNATSVAVCLVGGVAADKETPEFNFTTDQLFALELLLTALRKNYPTAAIVGGRTCTSFDAKAWAVTQGF